MKLSLDIKISPSLTPVPCHSTSADDFAAQKACKVFIIAFTFFSLIPLPICIVVKITKKKKNQDKSLFPLYVVWLEKDTGKVLEEMFL